MRLCFIAQEQAGITHPVTGGLGTWMAAVAPGLAERGHDVHVVLPFAAGARPLAVPPGLEVHALRHLGSGAWQDLVTQRLWPEQVARRLRRLGPFDVVVAHDWGGPGVAYATSSGRRSPFVTHLHSSLDQIWPFLGDHPRGRLSPVLSRLQMRRERRQARASDAIAGCSTAVLRDAVRRWSLDPRTADVVPSVLDVARVRTLAEGPAPVDWDPGGDPVVAFAGRLYGLKGVEELVRAMRRLWDGGLAARLLLVGSDGGWQGQSMLEHLRELAGAHVERLHHMGALPRDELFALLKAADVVALPSHWEAFPLVLLETMAVGRPIVTTSGHGADDLITDGVEGLVVEPRRDDALAAAIARLLEDPQLAARLAAAAARRAEHFDIGPGLERFERYYARAAELPADRAVGGPA